LRYSPVSAAQSLFVDLSALTKPQFVPTAVASAPRVHDQANDPFGSLVAFVGDKKILLVLDNAST